MLRFGSLFAGIGGFDLACELAGMSCAWQVEIEPRAQDVLRFHWPDVERHSDVREVGGATLAPVDLIVGGFPCQDLSVAGRRAGLGGERSGLFWQLVRVVREVRPRWLLLENVGGLLSSEGWRDLGAVLGALGECGYMGAFRCLDSQHFGVPQRRYRIFIVGHLGASCPAEILLEPDCLPGDLAAREQAREDLARPIGCGSPRGSGYRNDADTAENLVTGAITERFGRWAMGAPEVDAGLFIPAHPLRAQHNASHRADSDTYIAHALCSEGADASEDGTGRGTPLVTAFNWQSGGDCRQRPSETGTDALHVGQVPAVCIKTDQTGARGKREQEELAWTLDQGSPQVVGFALNQRREGRLQEVAGSVHEPSGTQVEGAVTAMGVRRLTPRECERLQGFPDDWTRYGRREDSSVYELTDAPRYRALGNAVTVNVAEWIARRLASTHPTAHPHAPAGGEGDTP